MRDFLKNFLYNFSYQVITIVLPVVTVPYISRVLGATGVGVYTFSNSIANYFSIFALIGLNTLGTQRIASAGDDTKKRSSLFFSINIVRLMLLVVISFLYFLFYFVSLRGHYGVPLMLAQWLFILGASLDTSWFLMGIEKFKLTVMRNLIVKLVSVILIFTVVNKTNGILAYTLVLNLSSVFGALLLIPLSLSFVDRSGFKVSNVREILIDAIIFFFPTLATTSYTILNKILIGVFVGSTASGFFQQSDTIIRLVLTFVTTINTVLLPRMARQSADQDSKLGANGAFSYSVQFVNILIIGATFGIFAVADKFVPFFFGSEFVQVIALLKVQAVSMWFAAISSLIGWGVLFPMNMPNKLTRAVGIGAIASIVLTPIFAIWNGVFGATVASLVSEVIVFVVLVISSAKIVPLSILKIGIFKTLISGVTMFVVIKFVNTLILTSTLTQIVLDVILGGLVFLLMLALTKVPLCITVMNLIKVRGKNNV